MTVLGHPQGQWSPSPNKGHVLIEELRRDLAERYIADPELRMQIMERPGMELRAGVQHQDATGDEVMLSVGKTLGLNSSRIDESSSCLNAPSHDSPESESSLDIATMKNDSNMQGTVVDTTRMTVHHAPSQSAYLQLMNDSNDAQSMTLPGLRVPKNRVLAERGGAGGDHPFDHRESNKWGHSRHGGNFAGPRALQCKD